jgi:hypothetical protein
MTTSLGRRVAVVIGNLLLFAVCVCAIDVLLHVATAAAWLFGVTHVPETPMSVSNGFSRVLGIMLSAAPLGLLSSRWMRHLGNWRLLIPACAFAVAAVAYHLFAGPLPAGKELTMSMDMRSPAVQSITAEAVAVAFLAGIVPAVFGAWLGTKLWPASLRQAAANGAELKQEPPP